MAVNGMDAQAFLAVCISTVWPCHDHASSRTCVHHAILEQWIWFEQLGVELVASMRNSRSLAPLLKTRSRALSWDILIQRIWQSSFFKDLLSGGLCFPWHVSILHCSHDCFG